MYIYIYIIYIYPFKFTLYNKNNKKLGLGYDTELHPMVRYRFWSIKEYGATLLLLLLPVKFLWIV